jgi:hypothetical protein
MRALRRLLGKLFDPPSPPLEAIVFERLEEAPSAPSQARSKGIRVALEELLPHIAPIWIRSGDWSAQQTIEVHPDSFLESSSERPAVVSLRALTVAYPQFFRDPGFHHADPGVDLPMRVLREPIAGEPPQGPDALVETVEDRATYADWDGEARGASERQTEARESVVALRGVRLPAPVLDAGKRVPFEQALSAQPVPALSIPSSGPLGGDSELAGASRIDLGASTGGRPVLSPHPEEAGGKLPAAAEGKPPAHSARLRKILEAYVGTAGPEAAVPSLKAAEVREVGQGMVAGAARERETPVPAVQGTPSAFPKVKPAVLDLPPDSILRDLADESTGIRPPSQGELPVGSVLGGRGRVELSELDRLERDLSVGLGAGLEESFRMRFEELGLSLSRFSEVRGFALWQAGFSSHTGDLGLGVELGAMRLRLDRMLEGAIQVQGAQDGFSSVCLNHAKGGLSVFGAGTTMVAVAHHHEGMPSHLRAWICGWVSQPLRP